MIYLDNNATTSVTPSVMEAMVPYFTDSFYNPSSVAGEFLGINKVLVDTKEALASRLGGFPDEFTLTSGATESNNWVLRSLARKHLDREGCFNLVISSTEHPSVLETAKELNQTAGVNLCILTVDKNGLVLSEQLGKVVTPKTHLVSLILANNESGVIQDIASLSGQVKALNPHCLFHTDATQAVGKISVDLNNVLESVDLLSISGHKFHAPKGIGALFIRESVVLPALITGGGQQKGLRSGTENPAVAAGLKAALHDLDHDSSSMESMRNEFESRLLQRIPGIQILAEQAHRLPNTSMLILPNMEGEMAVSMLHQAGIIVSTGSACSSGADKPSHVATAMGIPYGEARNTVRVSFGNQCAQYDLDGIARGFEKIIPKTP